MNNNQKNHNEFKKVDISVGYQSESDNLRFDQNIET